MILREQLTQLNCNVKIGVKSGFVYCHNVCETTIEDLEGISYQQKKIFRCRLKDIEMYLENFDKFWENELRKRSEALLLDNCVPTKEQKEEVKAEWEKDRKKSWEETTKKKKTIKEFLENWKSIPEREVKEIYDSIDAQEPKGTKIIIVDGLENGLYWLTNEYKEKNYE